MKAFLLGFFLCCCVAGAAQPDSTDRPSAPPPAQMAVSDTMEVQSPDSLQPATPAVQAWMVPLAIVAAIASSFFLLFTLRSR
ncbi:MAG: hypothetical protein V1784_07755 [bacterium]